jgi:hypothetical protein
MNNRPSLDQVIDELVKDYRPKGDLFYLDISRCLKDRLGKKYPAEAFSLVCGALRGAGLKIWGD